MEFKISMPLSIYLPRKTMLDKKYIINFNNYHIWHRMVRNQIKQKYAEIVFSKLPKVKLLTFEVSYSLFKGSSRRCDRNNVFYMHDKFFCDALVKAGVVQDDSDEYYLNTNLGGVELDRENPRVEITVMGEFEK